MNNERRKKLSAIVKTVDGIRADINSVLNEEQNAYENLPDSLQYSDRGTDIELAVEALSKADDALCEAKHHLYDASM